MGLLARATPTPRQSITQLSTTQIDAFSPYTYFAAAGYCEPSTTLAWSCGTNCDANSDFIPVASGGDGADSVVVAHQGTDPSEIESLLTDGNLVFDSLDSDLFPISSRTSSNVTLVAEYYLTAHRTAEAILAAVTTALSDNGADSVTLTGHSLGECCAALSLLDAMYLPLHLPIPFGNQAFADYMDDTTELSQDNTDDACTTGAVPNIFDGDLNDHSGPFNGIVTRC
ncbi:hypothetical protein CPB85DRAFT_1375479 [Mucidula mucida]|nr:hypothetical protein CPB85DRAFT_1375479 [Mucidula mucida]